MSVHHAPPAAVSPGIADAGNAGASQAGSRRVSLRTRVLGAVLAINLVAAVVAGAVVVVNARVAAGREMVASIEMAENMVREVAERVATEPGTTLAAAFPPHLRHLRHVRISLEGPDGRPAALPAEGAPANTGAAPSWFARLIGVSQVTRRVDVVADGVLIGRVRIEGVPDDEVAEVWDDVFDFASVALAVNFAILTALFVALGQVRRDLSRFRDGLDELEHNEFACRVEPPRTRELAEVAERFNAFAETLGAAREENAHLYARLVSLQEDERRQIAGDLHDELGPLMFGLKASADSLARLAATAPAENAERMVGRAKSLIEIVERMQVANRRLLARIRPAALGHVPLKDVLSSLVADFRQHDPERRFALESGVLADHYEPSFDATVYRCAQEGITNALKHGNARSVRITVGEEGRRGAGALLRLVVADDGEGPPALPKFGHGLSGMTERVRALGGTCRLERGTQGGARLLVELPIPLGHAAPVSPASAGGGRVRSGPGHPV